MTSQITPAAGSPASRARSTAASVWPRRSSTPPSRATRGSKWPGDTNAAAVALSDMMVRIVSARSKAEMPVEIPSRASTVIVNAVEKGSRFSLLIWRSANRSARSRVRARQMSPRPNRAMKLMASGLAWTAGMMRSPSFSRSASSTMTTIRPACISERIASTELISTRGAVAIRAARLCGSKGMFMVRRLFRGLQRSGPCLTDICCLFNIYI